MRKETLKRANEIDKALENIDYILSKTEKISEVDNDYVGFTDGYSLQLKDYFTPDEKVGFQVAVKLFKEVLINHLKSVRERLEIELKNL